MSNYTYTVTGKGSFPIEALRLTGALPATEDESIEIEETFSNYRPPDQRQVVTLNGPNPPVASVIAVWESFGWRVVK